MKKGKAVNNRNHDLCVEGKPHYWFIDGSNVGRCKRPGCTETRDFGAMLRKNPKQRAPKGEVEDEG